jgi:glucose-1-phosphate cytidylyltransferase
MAKPLNNADIPVVILCGGKGLRIREVSELLPKPMLNIGEKPVLWHIMKTYAHHGFRNFILCLGHKGDVIRNYFLNFHANNQDVTLEFQNDSGPPKIHYHGQGEDELNWSVTLAETGADTMTGARVARVARYINQEVFMLTYGDGVGNIDIAKLLEWHVEQNKMVTVTGVRPQSRFGQLEISGDAVQGFTEKPQSQDGYVSGGFIVANRDFLSEYLTTSESCILENDGLSSAARDGNMSIFRHDGFWMPMDNSLEYNALNVLWAKNEAPWKVW